MIFCLFSFLYRNLNSCPKNPDLTPSNLKQLGRDVNINNKSQLQRYNICRFVFYAVAQVKKKTSNLRNVNNNQTSTPSCFFELLKYNATTAQYTANVALLCLNILPFPCTIKTILHIYICIFILYKCKW